MRIHIVMSGNTFEYFEYCVKNHTSLADDPGLLSFCAYALDKKGYDLAAQFLEKKGGWNGEAVRLPDGSGSIGHMLGLNAIFAKIDGDDDPNVISDADCIVLMKGWDAWLRKQLKTHKAIGTTYEDVGGFSSGSDTVQTYKRVPNFSWCALGSGPDWSNVDTSSDKGSPFAIATQEQSETFNLPIGFSVYREPCWQFPIFLKQRGVTPYPLDFVRPTSEKAKAVLSGEDYHTEYQLLDGTPYVAHQRGSMSKRFRVHHLSKTFYDACEAYIGKNNG